MFFAGVLLPIKAVTRQCDNYRIVVLSMIPSEQKKRGEECEEFQQRDAARREAESSGKGERR